MEELPRSEKVIDKDKAASRGIPERSLRLQQIQDFLFENLARSAALLVLALLLSIIGVLIAGSMPSIEKFGWGFLTNPNWDPVAEDFGALVPIVGTLVTSAIALIVAVPVSFGIAIFLTELAPSRLKTPLGTAIELLAAIPSIIYGMWGLFVFAPFFAKSMGPWINTHMGSLPGIGVLFRGPPIGIGLLTAALILAIMIIPFISAVMRDVFDTVPTLLKESAYGLGSTTWEVVWKVVLPYTKTGVTGGIILGLGRALGETMAVTFVIGNAHKLSASLLMPSNTISSALANEFNEAVGAMYTSALVELGLILFAITFVVLALARLLLGRLKRQEGAST